MPFPKNPQLPLSISLAFVSAFFVLVLLFFAFQFHSSPFSPPDRPYYLFFFPFIPSFVFVLPPCRTYATRSTFPGLWAVIPTPFEHHRITRPPPPSFYRMFPFPFSFPLLLFVFCALCPSNSLLFFLVILVLLEALFFFFPFFARQIHTPLSFSFLSFRRISSLLPNFVLCFLARCPHFPVFSCVPAALGGKFPFFPLWAAYPLYYEMFFFFCSLSFRYIQVITIFCFLLYPGIR